MICYQYRPVNFNVILYYCVNVKNKAQFGGSYGFLEGMDEAVPIKNINLMWQGTLKKFSTFVSCVHILMLHLTK